MDPFRDLGDGNGTRVALMKATYEALSEHGYADLTIERIGEEFEKSVSLVYHHYDSKDALLVDFLEFMLDRFEADVAFDERDDARARLRALFDRVLSASIDDERRALMGAITELRAQAPHNEAFREQFARSDRFFHARIAAIIEAGIDQGVFRDVDPDRTAELLLTTINGAMIGRVTTAEEAPIRAVRAELDEYVRLRLLTDGAS
ncbi:TetR family transcriptional regulator [Halobacteriales archaeon QS_8_65_32]|nr:MAG: TetR family transcriptional regulator [Halobacteriales archaeon QS_8_65_32]